MYELFYFLSIYTRVTDEFSRQQLGLTQKKKDKQYPDIFAEQLDIKNAESPQWLETCDKSELDAYKKIYTNYTGFTQNAVHSAKGFGNL